MNNPDLDQQFDVNAVKEMQSSLLDLAKDERKPEETAMELIREIEEDRDIGEEPFLKKAVFAKEKPQNIEKPRILVDNNKSPKQNISISQNLPESIKIEEDKQEKPPQTIQREITKSRLPKKPNKALLFLKFVGMAIVVFVGIYLFLTFPAIWAKTFYWWKVNITKEKPKIQTIIPEAFNTDEIFLETVVHFSASEKPKENSENPNQVKKELPTKESLGLTEITNDQLYVPKLDIKVPVIWNSSPDGDGQAMLKDLQQGVVHFKGTALPNQEGGNVFISGHSSYYWWDSGKYKTVFANLDQMDVGDEIAIGYENKVYIYKVWEKIVVKPEEIWVLDQNTNTPNLSLMTCVPVGTNLRRLIVRSELVTVAEDKAEISVPSKESSQPQLLPVILPNLDTINFLPWRW